MNTHPYAGFWKRAIAFILDSLIVSLPITFIFFPLLLWQGFAVGKSTDENFSISIIAFILLYILWQIIGAVCMWLYFAFMESGTKQATWGKRIMKIKVIRKDGQRISFARATGRFFAKILSYLVFYFGFIMAGFTNRKCALHDYIADTYVVRADFDPQTDTLPDTPSHTTWLIVIGVVLAVFMIFLAFLQQIQSIDTEQAYHSTAKIQMVTHNSQPSLNGLADKGLNSVGINS